MIVTERSHHAVILLITLFIVVGLSACPDTSTLDPGGVLLPLKVGNSWEYRTHDGLSNRWEVVGTAVVKGDDVAIVEITDSNGSSFRFYFANRYDGLYGYGSEGAENDRYLLYKYPASAGTSYSVAGMTVVIERTEEEIDVPAGKFACYKYVFDGSAADYFAPGVGQIKETDPGSFNELQSYVVNGSDL